MRSTHWLLVVTIFLLGATATPPAHAQDKGWYVGLGLGDSDDEALEDDNNGFKFFGGYRFNKHLALNGALISLGYDIGTTSLAKSGISVQTVGILPISQRFLVLAKIGFFAWDVTIEDTSSCYLYFGGVVCDDRKIDDGIDPAYGLGIQYRLGAAWGVRGEWERFEDVGDSDIDMVSLSFTYGF